MGRNKGLYLSFLENKRRVEKLVFGNSESFEEAFSNKSKKNSKIHEIVILILNYYYRIFI
jgi:hypothetical protein